MSLADKPLATPGLTSYRYRGRYGWVMLGAKNSDDALAQAARSVAPDKPLMRRLQVWDGERYIPMAEAMTRPFDAPAPRDLTERARESQA